jgi:alpha-galactosidase
VSKVARAIVRRLDGGALTLILEDQPGAPPKLVYLGPILPTASAGFSPSLQPLAGPSLPDAPIGPSLLPTSGFGDRSEPGLILRRAGSPLLINWSNVETRATDEKLHVALRDDAGDFTSELTWSICPRSGVVQTFQSVRNQGATPLTIEWAASLCAPLPTWAQDIAAFPGRWGYEQNFTRMQRPPGQWTQINRSGRTGFSGATFLLMAQNADDTSGAVLAFHLGWSGDHRLLVDSQQDGTAIAQMGAFDPGAIILAPGESWATPMAYFAFSAEGLNGLSDAFHIFARTSQPKPRSEKPRPVHFNSWEGVFFDVNEPTLRALADGAAALGAERFVLDDGWFEGRVNDQAGLGDWRPDSARFPEGLGPFIAYVHALGMEFGLWVEPEMVNPDSNLYRTHPDWVVQVDGAPRQTMRHQLTLDLTRADVRAYLFDAIDALLRAHPIAYLKWDCNRDLFPAQAIATRQIEGFYELWDQVRTAHPHVEMEACASGGARLDFAMLSRCDRFWPSDATDAIERLRINRWAGLLFPLERLGTHVGPTANPITGRRLPMDFRAKVALFGHMGVELDPRRLSVDESRVLQAHIALYKSHRALLHSGAFRAWTSDDGAEARMVINAEKSEAIALFARAGAAPFATAAPVRLPGLDPKAIYHITLPQPWPQRAMQRLSSADQNAWRVGREVSGAFLMAHGISLPLADPETAWLAHLTAIG